MFDNFTDFQTVCVCVWCGVVCVCVHVSLCALQQRVRMRNDNSLIILSTITFSAAGAQKAPVAIITD
ncbi:hypothetical protein INR49_027570 [Caranx melampygus]|nr:hypothetical protein INR49_027570 [Caranx melampygus]